MDLSKVLLHSHKVHDISSWDGWQRDNPRCSLVWTIPTFSVSLLHLQSLHIQSLLTQPATTAMKLQVNVCACVHVWASTDACTYTSTLTSAWCSSFCWSTSMTSSARRMVSSSFLAGVANRPTFSRAQRSRGQCEQRPRPITIYSFLNKVLVTTIRMQPKLYKNIPSLR